MLTARPDGPESLWYWTQDQTWAQPQPSGLVRVGITALGLKASGEIYMCRPKSVGSGVEQGRSIGVVELSKSIVSVKSPLSGTVRVVNEALQARPELVFRSPYEAGWLAEVEPLNWADDCTRLVTGEAVKAAMEQWAWLNQLSE